MLRPLIACFAALAVSLVAAPLLAEPVSTAGKVTAVTVYQGQALVTREAAVDGGAGLAELVITDLPARVTPGSLYAEPIGDVEIRSVRYRVRPVAEDTREEVRELDAKIQSVGDELAAVRSKRQLLKSRSSYLAKLENFTTKTASTELTSGVLDATTLKELTKTIFEGRAEVAEGELAVAKAERELNKQLSLLGAKRQQITSSSSKTVREAVVFVNKANAGGAKVRLTYLVSGATWSPSYNLRASEKRDLVTVEYNASIQQQSGEDWTDVEMTLSTASPSLVAAAPSLLPLPIQLASARPAAQTAAPSSKLGYLKQREVLERQQRDLSLTRRAFANGRQSGRKGEGAEFEQMFGNQSAGDDPFGGEVAGASVRGAGGFGGGGGGFGASYDYADFGRLVARSDRGLNAIGNQVQILDWNNDKTPRGSKEKPAGAEGISVVYRLANRTSLPSRADKQLIPIGSLPLAGDFYRVARPVLTEYVYEEASLVNDTQLVLLAGPAATFLGDRFVGRGAVPTVAVGESFTVGLGIDESLRVTRELVKKDRRVQGANRLVRTDYKLTVENFGAAAAKVRLFDRLPSTPGDDNAEIKVTLLESNPKPAGHDAKQRKQGILRWDVEAPAKDKAVGSTSVTYAMQLEYDRNRTIVEAVAAR